MKFIAILIMLLLISCNSEKIINPYKVAENEFNSNDNELKELIGGSETNAFISKDGQIIVVSDKKIIGIIEGQFFCLYEILEQPKYEKKMFQYFNWPKSIPKYDQYISFTGLNSPYKYDLITEKVIETNN